MKKKSPDYLEIRLPRFSSQNKINTFLVLILVVLAAVVGVLSYKVLSLEKSVKEGGQNQAQNSPEETAPPQIVKVDTGKLPVLGDKNAKVTIVEFSDFQCPFCKSYFDDTAKKINDTYIKTGKVKFAYRHFPLPTIHANAQITAEATECANEQDKFWEYHDLLFKNQAAWATLSATDILPTLTEYAGQLGLNTDQFGSCLSSNKYKDRVDADVQAAGAIQVTSTPTFFVNGYRIVGAQPFEEFKKLIEQELKK